MNKYWLTFILLCCTTICSAKEYKETLDTTDGSRITITYDLQYDNNDAIIKFKNVSINLSGTYRKKYKPMDMEVIFFDMIGVYEDGLKVHGDVSSKTFKIPSSLVYEKSEFGYFYMKGRPKLEFMQKEKGEINLSIPLYLAYRKKDKELILLTEIDELSIKLNNPNINKSQPKPKTVESTTLSLNNPVEDDTELEESIIDQIKSIEDLLEKQTKYPFSEILNSQIEILTKWKTEVKDNRLLKKIDNCFTSCENKRMELEDEAQAEVKRVQAEAERKEQMIRQQEQARQDSIAQMEKKQAEADKKQNIWMIIGGVIFGVICFIGNQVFQHFRSIRSQKNMFEMQQDIARRAEYEAKRHAHNYTRKKTNEVVNNVRKATDNLGRNKVNKTKSNNSTKFSI